MGNTFNTTPGRKPTNEETVGAESTLPESRTSLRMEAYTQAIKLAEYLQ